MIFSEYLFNLNQILHYMVLENSASDVIIAIATALMFLVGYGMGIKSFMVWREKKSPLILLTALLFISLPTPWLAYPLRVISIAFGSPIDDKIALYLFAWSVPALAIVWLYITSSLFVNQKYFRYIALVITVIPGLIFIVGIYFLDMWSVTLVPDSSSINYIYDPLLDGIIMFNGVLGLLLIFPSYTYFSINSKSKLFRFKSRSIAVASLLFVLAGVTDAVITFDNIVVVLLLRIVLTASLVFLYLGYNTPERIRLRYT